MNRLHSQTCTIQFQKGVVLERGGIQPTGIASELRALMRGAGLQGEITVTANRNQAVIVVNGQNPDLLKMVEEIREKLAAQKHILTAPATFDVLPERTEKKPDETVA